MMDDPFQKAQAHARQGKSYLSRNKYHEACRHYQQAVDLFQDLGKRDHLARALNHLGVCLTMTDQASAALEPLHRAQELTEKQSPTPLRAALWGNLGIAHTRLGNYTKAIRCHQRALEEGQNQSDRQIQLQAHIHLVDTHFQAGAYRQALAAAQEALDMARTQENHPARITILDLLGMISSRQGDLPAAVEYHRRAADIAQELGDTLRLGVSLANQALALEGLTKLEQARPLMRRAHHIFVSLESDYQLKTEKDLQRITAGLDHG